MNVVWLFSLGPTTAKDYLKAGTSAEFQPFRNKSKSLEKFLPRIQSCSTQIGTSVDMTNL